MKVEEKIMTTTTTSTLKVLAASVMAIAAISSVQAADPVYYSAWQSSEVRDAWNAGYTGKGVRIIVVDDYTNSNKLYGKFASTTESKGHGFWTSQEAALIAPGATVSQVAYQNGRSLALASTGLNVVNASYGVFALAKYANNQVVMNATEQSLVNIAKNGQAVVVKAAGNDSVAINTATKNGTKDFLASNLIGTQSAIFVGALDRNGKTNLQAKMASYSNTAGNDVNVQRQFLVVGVQSSTTNLAGTSFAAPIVSGYAAILGSKFTNANATQIANQLLNTARTDTVAGYNASTYGRGEASLTRALAPVSIK